ncbi:DUF2243 domain-containing protein [Oxalobacteraceae bacterium OTU3REALA1]|nr:DUF2243 domain-containing protein [Oxalobacteraceae bacterium OTU3REALA1]
MHRPRAVNDPAPDTSPVFPTGSGIWFGLGLGGFFDGIVLHQLLQWHHMVSSRYPTDTVDNLRFNTLWDGIFHSATYVFVALGLYYFWKIAHVRHVYWSGKLLAGTLLLGWGLFNVVEGLINHQLLGIHHVNETVPESERIYYDVGFLVWGAAMLAIGWLLYKSGKRKSQVK